MYGKGKMRDFVSVHWGLCLNISQTCWIFTVALFLLISAYLTAFGSPVSFFSFSVVTCLGCNFGLLLLLQHPDQNQYRDISLCFYFLAILVEQKRRWRKIGRLPRCFLATTAAHHSSSKAQSPLHPSMSTALTVSSSHKKWLKATAFACLNETTVFTQAL